MRKRKRHKRQLTTIQIQKRLAVIAAVFFIVGAVLGLSKIRAKADTAIPTTVTKDMAMSAALDSGILSANVNNDSLNYIPPPQPLQVTINGITYRYGYLAYGDPHGDQSQGDYRYIGYDYLGEDLTNLAFPPDENANGEDFAFGNWISEPWEQPNSSLTGAKQTPWDGNTAYRDDLISGILWTTDPAYDVNGYTIAYADANNPLWANITSYAHILMPPTKYTWGIARMWHYKNGNLLYITVPMPPLILAQLIPPVVEPAKLIVKPPYATIMVGQSIQYHAYYYPPGWLLKGGGQDVTNEAQWSNSNPNVVHITNNPVTNDQNPTNT